MTFNGIWTNSETFTLKTANEITQKILKKNLTAAKLHIH